MHKLDRYHNQGVKLVVSETPEAIEVLHLARSLADSAKDKERIREAIENKGFVDYGLNDEVPAIASAAKALGYDGIKVHENNDLPGSPTSSFIWSTHLLRKVPPVDFSPGGGVKFLKFGASTIVYGVATDGKSGQIDSVRTPSGKRNKGSTRAAVKFFLEEADRRGLALKIIASPLDKRTTLHRLVGFYRSVGFEPTGETVNAYSHPVMRRPAAEVTVEPSPEVPRVTMTPAHPTGLDQPNRAGI